MTPSDESLRVKVDVRQVVLDLVMRSGTITIHVGVGSASDAMAAAAGRLHDDGILELLTADGTTATYRLAVRPAGEVVH